jgi:hypothetical protein
MQAWLEAYQGARSPRTRTNGIQRLPYVQQEQGVSALEDLE